MAGMRQSAEAISYQTTASARAGWRIWVRTLRNLFAACVVAVALLGGASVDSVTQMHYSINSKVHLWIWDLIAWEVEAIAQKLSEQFLHSADHLSEAEQAALVQAYLERARRIGELEGQIERLYSEKGDAAREESASIQHEIEALRSEQEAIRPTVEVILEGQVAKTLRDQGVTLFGRTFPPVWFTFTEPPKKLVVSPRGRILTAYYVMLQPELPADERDRIESAIFEEDNLSAYIANIGGLGAYPSLVIDRAALDWVLSTIAHEWVHNYLTLFPLGLNYNTSAELTIMNETVADIVGEEVGRSVLERFYPEVARELTEREAAKESEEKEPPAFDFRKEMRHTREVVDQFLALGRIRDAEEYMEIRRLLFVENGYPIRKLNQAYFAFHGSYGTAPAASSPIGPKMEELRSLTPDVPTFLRVVRGFTSPEDLDRALEEWRASAGRQGAFDHAIRVSGLPVIR